MCESRFILIRVEEGKLREQYSGSLDQIALAALKDRWADIARVVATHRAPTHE